MIYNDDQLVGVERTAELTETFSQCRANRVARNAVTSANLQKVARNPVSIHEGGYGKPLGHHNGNDLSGLFKIKFRDIGLRVVYKTEMVDSRMKIIVVSARSDDQVYREAARRRAKYDL